MKTYPIPDQLLAATVTLLERLPATRDVRMVLNALETAVTQHDNALADEAFMERGKPPVQNGGGGPGPED